MEQSILAVSEYEGKFLSTGNGEQVCKLAQLDPFNPAIRDFVVRQFSGLKLNCSKQYFQLFDSFVDSPYPRLVPKQEIVKNQNIQSCCFRNIIKEKETGNKRCLPVSLTNETKIEPEHEFISIVCIYKPAGTPHKRITVVDMHAFIHPKPDAQKRVENWKSSPDRIRSGDKGDRMNVIVLGLDSMSRMHFTRTMPKTQGFLLKHLNAVEMEGFHKVGGWSY